MKIFHYAALMLATLAAPAFASVTVSNPGNGAEVPSPFNLSASASSCSSQPVSAMGYSLDSSTDTTIVDNTSIDAQVPAPTGAHTLHVKAWGKRGAVCVSDIALTITAAVSSTNADGITVSSPAKDAEVPPSFNLSAKATSCWSQPVSAMGYSFDNSSHTTIVDNTSIDAQLPASSGAHVLHVKAWGRRGAACTESIPITVSTAMSSSSSGITVVSPANHSVVGTSFSLVAGATACSSQALSAMGYSLDNSSDTTIVKSTSVGATLTTSAGAHTLHVKAWGNHGAACHTDIAITAQSAPAAVLVSNQIHVSSPSNGAAVPSSFDLAANAASCSSQPVSSVGYSLDSSAETIFNGTSVNASISASAGAHTLHIKAWGHNGVVLCSRNVSITAAGEVATATSAIPSDAVSVSNIQTLSNWRGVNDTGTGAGTSSGDMSLVNSPSLSTHARGFVTQFSNYGGERYYVSFGDDKSATNFFYDGWIYIADSAKEIGNLEMDMNQTMPNGQTAIFGIQCDGYSKTWDYTKNAGNPEKPSDQWIHSNAACDVRNWSTDTWHHIQISYSRDDSGNITYQSVWLDNVEQKINATVPSAFALGWAPSLLTNFQVDGLGQGGSATVYLDKLTVYRW